MMVALDSAKQGSVYNFYTQRGQKSYGEQGKQYLVDAKPHRPKGNDFMMARNSDEINAGADQHDNWHEL